MPIIEIFIICAVVTQLPYYDCNDEWKIYYHDDYRFRLNDQWIVGWADYGQAKEIHLAKEHYYWLDATNKTVLEHELEHLECKCNFHENETKDPIHIANLPHEKGWHLPNFDSNYIENELNRMGIVIKSHMH